MKKMSKRYKNDHQWHIKKFKGDAAIYAYCYCGFSYGCYYQKGLICYLDPNKLYPYCPMCGAKKRTYNINPEKMDCERWTYEENKSRKKT